MEERAFNDPVSYILIDKCLPLFLPIGLTAPDGNCTGGYFCSLRSIEPAPDSQAYGHICPTGYYCPPGTDTENMCGIGTYQPNTGADAIDDCLPCSPGKYCDNQGQADTTGMFLAVTAATADVVVLKDIYYFFYKLL